MIEQFATNTVENKDLLKYIYHIVNEQNLENVRKIKYLGGGSFGRVFLIDLVSNESFVIKFLLVEGMMKKETHDIRLLQNNCPIAFPKLLFSRFSDGCVPIDCYGMEYIRGKTVLFSFKMLFWSKKKRLLFADKVTTALHAIHNQKNSKFGDTLAPKYDNWIDYYKKFADDVFRDAEKLYSLKKLDKKIILTMRAAYKAFDVIFSEPILEASLIHGDLNVGNIMVSKDNQIVFIDPLNSSFADAEYDLFQFDNLTGKYFYLRETYIKKYGSSRYCLQKLAFYGLWNEVYCYIKTGKLIKLIMKPLVKNMRKRLKEL